MNQTTSVTENCYHTEESLKLNLKTQQSLIIWDKCVWGKHSEGIHMIIMTPLFSKNFIFKMFPVYTNMQSQQLQISTVLERF